jgi:hypothetical protein
MPDPAVDSFIDDPGAWADPEQAAGLIVPGLRAETAQRLLGSQRLAARVSRLLAERLGPGDPAALEPVDLALVSADRATLESVALSAGAVWHTRRVRALVLGADIAMLCTRLGDETRRAALRHAALALETAGGNGGHADDANALADDIERDGALCMAAWIDALPGWAASRVRLKWRHTLDLPADDDGRASAVRIVRTLAAEALLP